MPSDNALALYATSMSLSTWLGTGRLVVMRADNSTCPLEDEHAVFRGLLGGIADEWLHSESRSLAFQDGGNGDAWMETGKFALLIHFWILFLWHVHVVVIHEDRILRPATCRPLPGAPPVRLSRVAARPTAPLSFPEGLRYSPANRQ